MVPSLLLTLAALSSGCEPSCEKLAEQTPGIEIGTGESEFSPVEDDDQLTLAWGMQGGQHIWSALRVYGVHRGAPFGIDENSIASRPDVHFSLASDLGVLASYDRQSQQLEHLSDGGAELTGATAIIRLNPYDTPGFFPEDFDPEGWETWEEGEEEDAWEYAFDLIGGAEWTFALTMTDSCGTELNDARTVLIEGFGQNDY
jgi:hypothetical protein